MPLISKKNTYFSSYFFKPLYQTKSFDPDFIIGVTCTLFWLNRGFNLKVYFDLCAAAFSKSTVKDSKFGTIEQKELS